MVKRLKPGKISGGGVLKIMEGSLFRKDVRLLRVIGHFSKLMTNDAKQMTMNNSMTSAAVASKFFVFFAQISLLTD